MNNKILKSAVSISAVVILVLAGYYVFFVQNFIPTEVGEDSEEIVGVESKSEVDFLQESIKLGIEPDFISSYIGKIVEVSDDYFVIDTLSAVGANENVPVPIQVNISVDTIIRFVTNPITVENDILLREYRQKLASYNSDSGEPKPTQPTLIAKRPFRIQDLENEMFVEVEANENIKGREEFTARVVTVQ